MTNGEKAQRFMDNWKMGELFYCAYVMAQLGESGGERFGYDTAEGGDHTAQRKAVESNSYGFGPHLGVDSDVLYDYTLDALECYGFPSVDAEWCYTNDNSIWHHCASIAFDWAQANGWHQQTEDE